MRRVTELIWHCTATPEGREVTVEEVTRWHRERDFRTIGYHKLVHLDGSVSEGRPESQQGAHVLGRNAGTLGYAYAGGRDRDGRPKDTRTKEQRETMARLTTDAIERYGLKAVSGHRDYSAKACPCFDARGEYADLLGIVSAHVPELLPDDELVRQVQRLLIDKGYPEVGEIDGDMGSRTRGALLAFKADNGLALTAALDDATITELMRAPPRAIPPERAAATATDLRKRGSRNIAASDGLKAVAGGGGAIGAAVGIAEQVNVAGETAAQLNDAVAPIRELFMTIGDYWWLIVIAIAAAAFWYAWQTSRARLDDHRSGKTA